MLLREIVYDLKWWFYAIVFLSGITSGACHYVSGSSERARKREEDRSKLIVAQFNDPQTGQNIVIEKKFDPSEPKDIKEDGLLSGCVQADLDKTEIPVFSNNALVYRLFADELLYRAGKPVLLKKPVLYHYAKDGKTVIKIIRSNLGEIDLGQSEAEETMKSLRLFGGGMSIELKKDPFAIVNDKEEGKSSLF